MGYIEFRKINKLYEGGVHAIEDVSFDIDKEQFTVLVGPSGCGKSTFLRMLAGLEEVTTGTITMDGKIINEVLPKDRNISMVFQNYALYPHISVYENIAFGLRLKKVEVPVKDENGNIIKVKKVGIPKEEIDQRVKEVAEKLELTDYLSRKPKQLSGGQKQRVSLARALVRNNDVFLLDEPLSNLDAKLRVEMRKVIKALHQNLKKPFIYVTHDQVEAMTMADKIVVLKLGVIQQIGSPKEIYDEPANLFVATFFGSPSMSIIKGTLKEQKGVLYVELNNKDKLYIPKDMYSQFLDYSLINSEVKVGFRPTSFRVNEPEHIDHYSKLHGKVFYKELFGSETLLKIKVSENEKMDVFVPNNTNFKIGDDIELYAHVAMMKLFDPVTERSIFGTTKNLTFKNVKYTLDDDGINFDLGGKINHYPVGTRAINTLEKKGEISVSFDVEQISQEKKDNSIELEGKVSSIKNLFSRNALFLEIKDRKEPLIIFASKDQKVKIGDKMKVYIDFDYINILKDDVSLLSKYDIRNTISGDDLSLVKNYLKIKENLESITLEHNNVKAITSRKDVHYEKDKCYKIKAICLDTEPYKDGTLLYYKIRGMKGYLTAILDKKIDMVKRPIVKLEVPRS